MMCVSAVMLRYGQRSLYSFRRNMIFLSLLLCTTPLLINSCVIAQSVDITLLDMLYAVDEPMKGPIEAYRHGLNASLWSRNFSIAGGRRISFVSINPSIDQVVTTINDVVDNYPNLLMVVGPADAKVAMAALPACKDHDLVMFAPLSMSVLMSFWDPHIYHFLADMLLSTRTLFRYAMTFLRVRRLGFMYAKGAFVGDREFELATALMKQGKREFVGVFVTDGNFAYTEDDKLFQDKWESFAATKPQAVILVGDTTTTTESFVRQMSKDPRTRSAYMLIPSFLQDLFIHAWTEAVSQGAHPFPGQVITTGSYPLPTETHHAIIRRYRGVMADYLINSKQTAYTDPEQHLHGSVADMMIAGWIAGEVLVQAVSQFNSLLTRKDFIDSLFNQRIYLIDDIVIGQFGGDVNLSAIDEGIVAHCNQGITTVYVRQFSGNISSPLPEGNLHIPHDSCYLTDIKAYDPAAVVSLNLTDVGEVSEYVVGEIIRAQKSAIEIQDFEASHEVVLSIFSESVDTAADVLKTEVNMYKTDMVLGLVLDSMLDTQNLAFVDPLFYTSRLNVFQENLILLSPTTEQQLYVFAQFVASLNSQALHAVIRGVSATSILNVLQRSLFTWGVKLTSSRIISEESSLHGTLPQSGLIIALEVNKPDIEVFAEHLEKNKDVRIAILYAPFAGYYPWLLDLFRGKDYADRLLFMTSLPHWNNTNSTTAPEILRIYHGAFRDVSARSPLSFSNFIASLLIQKAIANLKLVTWDAVVEYFYTTAVIEFNGITFGPFANNHSVTCTSMTDKDDVDCAKNYGATSISVWTMSRVFNPNEDLLFGPITPSMIYRDPIHGLTTTQLIGIIIGSVLVVTLLIVALVFMLRYRDARDNRNAPKDTEHPVTLIFTDIQSSTALWATCPEIMPEAVATHHRLIRRLIAKYKCYEVKTIGDSFMIACKSASAAVDLVIDLQRTFLQHDWGTSAIDAAYHEFEEQQAEEDADYEPPTARMDAAVYRKYWSGLRVRAGVHTGLSDIQHDEVTRGYDYYGSTSNTAARTESVAHGGQVLLTGAAYMALSAAERAGIDVTALGPVELRGVPQPMKMYQLNAVPGRAFAKLRLDRECDDLNLDTSTLPGTETSGSRSDALSPGAENVLAMLQDLLAPFSPQQRLKVLEALCKRWNVDMQKISNQKDVLAASRLAEQRLAIKISRVIESRKVIRDDLSDPTGLLSLSRVSMLMPNSSRASAPRSNALFVPIASGRSRDSDRQGKSSCVLIRPQNDTLAFSYTSSILLEEPSFIDFGGP